MPQNLKRWLPTSAPLISGAIASAVVVGLRKLHIVVLPHEVNDLVTPVIGFLTAAIVHKPSEGQVKQLAVAEEATLGSILAREFQGRLDSDPDLIQRVMNTVLTQVAPPVEVNVNLPKVDGRQLAKAVALRSNTAAANPGQPRTNYGAVVAPLTDGPRKVAIVSPTSAAVIPVPPDPPADAVDVHGNLTQDPVAPQS